MDLTTSMMDDFKKKESLEKEKLEETTEIKAQTTNLEVSEEFKEKNINELKKYTQDMLDKVDSDKKQFILQAVNTLDINDDNNISEFGLDLQKKLKQNSESLLGNEGVADVGEIGEQLNELMRNIQHAGRKEPRRGLLGWKDKLLNSVEDTKFEIEANVGTVKNRIDDLTVKLEKQNSFLKEDMNNIDVLMTENRALASATDIYIKAGHLKKQELELVIIPELEEKVRLSGDIDVNNELHMKKESLDRLDKRLMDLELTQQLLKNSYPQLTIMKSTSHKLSDKIQTSINSTVPIWINNVVQVRTLMIQKQAIEINKLVSDQTQEMLQTTSELTKTNAIENARQNEEGIISLETLQKTQSDLIETVRETLKIQQEGRENRENARIRIEQMNKEFESELLEATSTITKSNENHRKTVYDTTESIEYKKETPEKESFFDNFEG